jgi:Cap4 dsDNA endonuclease
MARSTYPIRSGFEYQDLYCTTVILEQILEGGLDDRFENESLQDEFIDDLVIRRADGEAAGYQVKFHVDQNYVESFESLTKRRKAGSKSVLQKLYIEWRSLKDKQHASYSVTFVSSSPAERGRFKLNPAIDARTRRFNERFFAHKDYARVRSDLLAHLQIDGLELHDFLQDVTWLFSYESTDGLRRAVNHNLRLLKLPNDQDAVARLLELISHLATNPTGELSFRGFVQTLWTASRFRDACEQRFPSLDFASGQPRRANSARVAVVAMQTLPAFTGTRYSCLEEPIPLADYRYAITAVDREALLDDCRSAWRAEYLTWLTKRVTAVLGALEGAQVDLLVFPRFALPIEVIAVVASWARLHAVNCIIGGHTVADASWARTLYQADLNLDIDALVGDTPAGEASAIIDAVLRHDRAARASLSLADSPQAKKESIRLVPDSVQLSARDGRLAVLQVPSRDAAQQILESHPARPEVLVLSAGIHVAELYDAVSSQELLQGCPTVVCSSSIHNHPSASILDKGSRYASQGDAWEGIALFSISYERSLLSGWSASVREDDRLPLLYRPQDAAKATSSNPARGLRGATSSRGDGVRRIEQGLANKTVEVATDDGATFFFRRGSEAKEVIRRRLPEASTEQIAALSSTLKAIEGPIEEYRKLSEVAVAYSPTPPALLPTRVATFHNRTTEKGLIARFLEGKTGKQLLLVHGPTGIGKKELLAEVQRLSSNRESWIRFRCGADSRLAESLAQFLMSAGENGSVPAELDEQFYQAFADAIASKGWKVVVFEDAHLLPISKDHHDHSILLEMLSFLCSERAHLRFRVIFVSDWRGHLQFSGNHRMETLSVPGLEREHVVEMLQEHMVEHPSRYPRPGLDELAAIAERLHGHPYITKLASVVLEECPASEVVERLYTRVETRDFVLRRLLGRIRLTEKEQQFLEYSSIFRLPVTSEAFTRFAGPPAHMLVSDLLDRFLLLSDGRTVKLHPLLTEFFASGLHNTDRVRRLHTHAFDYFASVARRRDLTVEERVQYVYHGFACGKSLDLGTMQAFAGSARSALVEGARNRDWAAVENAAGQLLSVWPYEPTAQIGMALALEATGRSLAAEKYFASLDLVSSEGLWLGIEFARNRIRRRDYDGAQTAISVLVQRYPNDSRAILLQAQLCERLGETETAAEFCERVLTSPGVREADAFLAGLILRDANRLDILVGHVGPWYRSGLGNEGLLRLYALGCVVTGRDPEEGLPILSQLWDTTPSDGYVVADYATSLRIVGRLADSKSVSERCAHTAARGGRCWRPMQSFSISRASIRRHLKPTESSQVPGPTSSTYRESTQAAYYTLALFTKMTVTGLERTVPSPRQSLYCRGYCRWHRRTSGLPSRCTKPNTGFIRGQGAIRNPPKLASASWPERMSPFAGAKRVPRDHPERASGARPPPFRRWSLKGPDSMAHPTAVALRPDSCLNVKLSSTTGLD